MSYADHYYAGSTKPGSPFFETVYPDGNRHEYEEQYEAIFEICSKYGTVTESWLHGEDNTWKQDFEEDDTNITVVNGDREVSLYWDKDFFYISDVESEIEIELAKPLNATKAEYWIATLLGHGPKMVRKQVGYLAGELRRRGVPASYAFTVAWAACKASDSPFAADWLQYAFVRIQFRKLDGTACQKVAKLRSLDRRGSAVCFYSEADAGYRSFNRERLESIEVVFNNPSINIAA